MPSYDLNALGSSEFEQLSQSLVKAVIGEGSITFGAGPDGAREATFEGEAPYPSTVDRWTGHWIFQAKFHDLTRTTPDKARKLVLAELDAELNKIVHKYHHSCDNYILITNVPLSSTARTGTHDVIAQKILPKYKGHVTNAHVWGYDDVSRLLERHPDIRQNYLHLLTPGDLIARLMRGLEVSGPRDLAETIRLFLASDYQSDRFANLDQAGEVGDESLSLTKIFVDLDVALRENGKPSHAAPELGRVLNDDEWASFLRGEPTSATKLLLGDQPRRVVLIGGPGQGKSTLGQHLAQIHRAALLSKLQEVIGDESEFTPLSSRIPLRVILRDYAQWVAQRNNLEQSPDTSVELYLSEQIGRLAANGVEVTKSDFHRIIRENPCLCIFDGLDEVVDPGLRNDVLGEIRAFLERAESGLSADMQVIGTSRPTGYLDEFDPASFTHVRLQTLSTEKARAYAERWIAARVAANESRAARIREAFAESMHDEQVQLLIHTPLQVTIILYVILSGDSPSRQRESLFNDYVDVIYRRERAKHRSILQTEKDVLLGLHEYLGYVIHRRAGDPEHVIAALTSEEFTREVRAYLRHVNPWVSGDDLEAQVRLLVTEAQDRLVLVVEGVPGQYGFELRSLQEYFAAAHLVQTSANSDQRYRRFQAIARSTHWRNVALFFAGRIGRLFRGEAANLIAASPAIDASSPDTLLRRGCALALDLAVDRAFGSNQPLQHMVVAEALAISESDPANWDPAEWVRRLAELPNEDVENHVVPALKRRLRALDRAHQAAAIELLHGLVPEAEVVYKIVEGWLASDDERTRLLGLRRAVELRLSAESVRERVPLAIHESDVTPVAEVLGQAAAEDPLYFGRLLAGVPLEDELTLRTIEAMTRGGYAGPGGPDGLLEGLETGAAPAPTAQIARSGILGLALMRKLGWTELNRRHYMMRDRAIAEKAKQLLGPWLDASNDYPDRRVSCYVEIGKFAWRVRMERCPVSVVEGFVDLVRDSEDRDVALQLAWNIGAMHSDTPARYLVWTLSEGIDERDALRDAREIVAEYSGPDGAERWFQVERQIDYDVRKRLSVRDRVDILLGRAPGWRRVGRARTVERLTGLGRDDLSRLLTVIRVPSDELELAPEVMRRLPPMLSSSDRAERANGLRVFIRLMTHPGIRERATLEGFGDALERVVHMDAGEDNVQIALRYAVVAIAASGAGGQALLEEALAAYRGDSDISIYLSWSADEAVAALLALARVLESTDSNAVKSAVAESVGHITGSAGSTLWADDTSALGALATIVATLLSSLDAARALVAVRLLGVLPSALVEEIQAPLASLVPNMLPELERAWVYALGTIRSPLTENSRAALATEVVEKIETDGMPREVTIALFGLLHRLADGEVPEINGCEADLGLPLPAPAHAVP